MGRGHGNSLCPRPFLQNPGEAMKQPARPDQPNRRDLLKVAWMTAAFGLVGAGRTRAERLTAHRLFTQTDNTSFG